MSDNKWIDDLNKDRDLDPENEVDQLIRSARAQLEGVSEPEVPVEPAPPTNQEPDSFFEVSLPESYADLQVADMDDDIPTPKAKGRLPAWVRMLIYVTAVLVSSVAIAFVGWSWADDMFALTKPDREVLITVPDDATIDEISQILYDQDMIELQWLFKLYCGFANAESKIDSGTYALNNYYDYHALINGMIASGGTRATATITIPEGYEAEQIYEMLEKAGVCTVSDLKATAKSYDFGYEFLENIPDTTGNRLEGYLFPDTYEFYVDDEPERVLGKFLENFDKKYDEDLEAALEPLNERIRAQMTEDGHTEEEIEAAMMDVHDVIIVASLIEKETSSSLESATISSVIYNRLSSQDYPLLQIDATIQYVLEERKEVLTSADLTIDSPYNTYRYPGLPAGPIANPGYLSIKAALNPEDTDYYFYALNADGSHHFSETYYEHNQFLQQLGGTE